MTWEQFSSLYDELPRTAEGSVLYRTKGGEQRSVPLGLLLSGGQGDSRSPSAGAVPEP